MIFSIPIEGDELIELLGIVADQNEQFPDRVPQKTPEEFLHGICMSYLSPRIRELYVFEAKTADIETLKQNLGGVSELKIKHKKRE